MWRFLCDRPAKWRIPLYVKYQYGILHVCQDCYRRVQQTEYDAERTVHVVTLRGLT